ncbi:DsbA family oxidoreductase [Agrococcus sp. ARC_14]|uniref:DsbA family oxidoreductase n=1 Tax=Agrococcus sp. ARC_14 TaxID=2919927 RepID=UPI001F051D4C|nr:DsbA family oxidoreductase [Agrococcus sp. ARC_14]MCH1882567.1 DsbA family oxidoreductase [Agrococcus sp. ARC_14]
MQIDIWSDMACPWCFIGKRRFERALGAWEHKDDVEVTWHSFQLDPTLPEHYDGTEVEYLASRKGMPAEQVRQMFEHVSTQAAGEGLHYDFDRLVVANSLRAHQLLHLAKAKRADAPGAADAVKEGLLSAHFEQGVDIGSADALVAIGTAAGLDEQEIREALSDERYLPSVRADIDQAQQLGVNGVPFFVFDMQLGLSGAQPAEVFTQALEQARALSLENASPQP